MSSDGVVTSPGSIYCEELACRTFNKYHQCLSPQFFTPNCLNPDMLGFIKELTQFYDINFILLVGHFVSMSSERNLDVFMDNFREILENGHFGHHTTNLSDLHLGYCNTFRTLAETRWTFTIAGASVQAVPIEVELDFNLVEARDLNQ